MDLSNLVAYDQEFPVKIKHPTSGEEVGITINIVSDDSERVARVGNIVQSDRWKAVFESEEKKLSVEQAIDFLNKEEKERLIAAIASWDFGGHSWDKLPPDPVCDEKNRRYLIEHPHAVFIRKQLSEASKSLANFSQAQPESSPTP